MEKKCLSLYLLFRKDTQLGTLHLLTFSFADVNDLENYLEKVRNKDEQLIADLSRILLNKTLLSIFDINPTLATWNASELKVFKGL